MMFFGDFFEALYVPYKTILENHLTGTSDWIKRFQNSDVTFLKFGQMVSFLD